MCSEIVDTQSHICIPTTPSRVLAILTTEEREVTGYGGIESLLKVPKDANDEMGFSREAALQMTKGETSRERPACAASWTLADFAGYWLLIVGSY